MCPSLGRFLLRARFVLFQRHRHRRYRLEEIDGGPFVVLPDVFHPELFHSSRLIREELLRASLDSDSLVLDLGTGSGYLALAAAARGARVVATDVNPEAVRCTRINALLRCVEDRIEPREGDLFAACRGDRFDLVLWNPPYFSGRPRDLWERSWRDDTDVRTRFASDLAAHLRPGGRALIVDSSLASERMEPLLERFSFRVRVAREKRLASGEQLRVLEVEPIDGAPHRDPPSSS